MKKAATIKYEPQADVLSFEVSDAPIEYASEVGDVVVHFSKDGKPVLIEVLEAKEFVKKAESAIGFKRMHPNLSMA